MGLRTNRTKQNEAKRRNDKKNLFYFEKGLERYRSRQTNKQGSDVSPFLSLCEPHTCAQYIHIDPFCLLLSSYSSFKISFP